MTGKTTMRWLWGLPVCVVALFVGQMLGAGLVSVLGMELPPSPVPVDEANQALLFLPAAIAFAVAMAGFAMGLAGSRWERWVFLAAFFYGVFGIGNVIESSVFTNMGGEVAMATMNLPPLLLGALAVALLFASSSGKRFGESVTEFLSRWTPRSLAVRLGLAIVAFPLIYFLFGLVASPIITPQYEQLDFLIIPPFVTMLKVVFVRSVLLLLVSLPVIIGWQASRGKLILALAVGHFVAVGFAGLVQAPFFPVVLRWTHGVEILADSICYAAALVWLLFPRKSKVAAQQPALQERLA